MRWLIQGGAVKAETRFWPLFLLPLVVSIVVPIVCLCYIRKNVVTERTQYRKGMAKFSLFLMTGGAINFLGQVLPTLLTYYSEAPGVYLGYGATAVSLIPTPIIIMAYLKPVQESLQTILTCGRISTRDRGSNIATSAKGTIRTDAKV